MRRTSQIRRNAAAITLACALAATATLSAQRGATTRESTPDVPSPASWGLNGYSVVFVVGDTQASGKSDPVPNAAQKALNDMQAFLPYRHYHLLDSAWMLCCTGFGQTVMGRIDGPNDDQYEYAIRTNPADGGRLSVHFSLSEAGGSAARASAGRSGGAGGSREISDMARAEYSRQLYEATKDRDDARAALTAAQKRYEIGLIQRTDMQAAQARLDRAEERIRDLQPLVAQRAGSVALAAPNGSVMDNSFYIAIGETVVIGTSRLKGDQALIALLTAVPKSGRKN